MKQWTLGDHIFGLTSCVSTRLGNGCWGDDWVDDHFEVMIGLMTNLGCNIHVTHVYKWKCYASLLLCYSYHCPVATTSFATGPVLRCCTCGLWHCFGRSSRRILCRQGSRFHRREALVVRAWRTTMNYRQWTNTKDFWYVFVQVLIQNHMKQKRMVSVLVSTYYFRDLDMWTGVLLLADGLISSRRNTLQVWVKFCQ